MEEWILVIFTLVNFNSNNSGYYRKIEIVDMPNKVVCIEFRNKKNNTENNLIAFCISKERKRDHRLTSA